MSVRISGFRSNQVLTILVSFYLYFVGVNIASIFAVVGLLVPTLVAVASSLALTGLLATLVFEVLGSLCKVVKELRRPHICFGMRLFLKPVTVIDCVKDPLAVVLMVKLPTATATTSAELTLPSLLPRYWVVPWSFGVTRRGGTKVVRISTVLKSAFIISGVKISVDFLLTLVDFSRFSIRLSVVKVSSLFEALTNVSMSEFWLAITDKLHLSIRMVIGICFSTFVRVLKSLLTPVVGLLKISRTSVLHALWSLLPFGLMFEMPFTRS